MSPPRIQQHEVWRFIGIVGILVITVWISDCLRGSEEPVVDEARERELQKCFVDRDRAISEREHWYMEYWEVCQDNMWPGSWCNKAPSMSKTRFCKLCERIR